MMKRELPDWTFLILVFVVLLLGFGVMFPRLGLYWDDWPVLTAARLKGVSSFWEFYQGERPFSAWTYIVTIPIIGTHPQVWHFFTLFTRWLTVISMWWMLRDLWPTHKRQVSWMALLFAVYPVFIQQPVAVAFSQHWMTFSLYFLSLGSMLLAIRKSRWFWAFTLLAVMAELIHILTMEYFWGLELLRPLLLWFVYSETDLKVKERVMKVVKTWVPYLVFFILGLILRMTFFVEKSNDPNRPDLLLNLRSQPVTTVLRLGQIALQDMINNLLRKWLDTIAPAEINIYSGVFWLSVFVAVIVGLVLYWYLSHQHRDLPESSDRHTVWIRQALILGLFGALLGPLPVWLTDRQALLGLYGSRFGLAAQFGMSVLLVAILEWLMIKPKPKLIIVAVLVGIAAGFHVRTAEAYHRSTLAQNSFYWQLYWRAPYIKPDTALLSNDELFIFVGPYSTSLGINLMYPQPQAHPDLAYWFIEMSRELGQKSMSGLANGIPLKDSFRNFTFNGNSLDSLVIYYKYGLGRCLRVLTPADTDILNLPDQTLRAAPVSNLGRIEPLPLNDSYPSKDLYGEEPEHDWCYFYQKISLANQLENWNEAASLADEAVHLGMEPDDAYEWLPIIISYARSGQWGKAMDRSNIAFSIDPGVSRQLCRVWKDISANTEVPQTEIENLANLRSIWGCSAQ